MARIYLDSCMVIYLVERHAEYGCVIRRAMQGSRMTLCVSPLVSLEVLVKPMRDRDDLLIRRYHRYLMSQEMLSIPVDVFDLALRLRVHHGLKTPDALHLATAMHHGCHEFWTNDDRLMVVAPGMAVNLLKRNE